MVPFITSSISAFWCSSATEMMVQRPVFELWCPEIAKSCVLKMSILPAMGIKCQLFWSFMFIIGIFSPELHETSNNELDWFLALKKSDNIILKISSI